MGNITKEQFEILAQAAEPSGDYRERIGQFGKEYAVFFEGDVVASAVMNQVGEYVYTYHLRSALMEQQVGDE